MMIPTACTEFMDFSVSPLETAAQLRDSSLRKNGTWGEALGARALFIMQTLISIVAAPLILLALLFAPALALCIDGLQGAFDTGFWLSRMCLLHLSAIPTAFIAAFLPHSLAWSAPAKQCVYCLGFEKYY